MAALDLLADGFGRVRDSLAAACSGLSSEQLEFRPDAAANSIAWLLWHTSRGQDAQVAALAGSEQVWFSRGWHDAFGLGLAPTATGYGNSTEDVALVRGLTPEQLVGYQSDTFERTLEILAELTDRDMARVVDGRWDPSVTVAVRLMSILADNLKHVGQAEYVRGLALRR